MYLRLNDSPPGEQPQYDDDERDDEQHVNEPARHVKREAEQPEHEQHENDGPKHVDPPVGLSASEVP